MVGILLAIVSIVFGVYFRTLSIGFLLDDFYHIDYLMRAFDGDNSELMKVIFGSWSGPTGLNSFRPFTTLGLLADFIVWKTNSFGYHLTNLLLYSFCSCAVVILVRQLLVERKERNIAAFVAGVLFVLYPIHPESVAWIIGRVDTQCVLFFLVSLIGYFHFRKSDSQISLVISFVAFFISLTTKEMAVVLPAVILFAEFLLATDVGFKDKSVVRRITFVGSYFLFLAIFAVVRTTAIGTLVGGYGSTDLKTTLYSFRNFLDLFTLKKIAFGVNDELPLKSSLDQFAYVALLLSIVPGIFAINLGRQLRLVAFLLLFLAVSLLPTFQIWHIYPNLVGSRLFFLGSVPLIVLISVLCFSPYGHLGDKVQKIARPVSYFSIFCLLPLMAFWYTAVSNNLKVWIRAGNDIENMRADLTKLSTSINSNQYIHLIDLPQDDAGAGLIGRPEYLKRMLKLAKAPLSDEGHYQKVITTEPLLSRQRSFLYPYTLMNLIDSKDVLHKLRWNNKSKRFEKWQHQFVGLEGSLFQTSVKENQASKSIAITNLENGGIVSKPGKLWFKVNDLNPFSNAWIKLKYESQSQKKVSNPARAKIIYRSSHQPESWQNFSIGPDADISKDGQLLFVPYRFRSWLLNGDIEEIGVDFTYLKNPIKIDSTVEIGGPGSIFPVVNLLDSSLNQSISHSILLPCDSLSPLKIEFDVSGIDGASATRIMVGRPQIPIAVQVTKLPPGNASLLFDKKVQDTSGLVEIPDNLIVNSIGVHQVCVIALDKDDNPIGYLSEPKLFEICPNRPPQIK